MHSATRANLSLHRPILEFAHKSVPGERAKLYYTRQTSGEANTVFSGTCVATVISF